MFNHHSTTQPEQNNEKFDVAETQPLDNSAQKHKIAIKPKKRHSSSAHRDISSKKQTAKPGER